MNPNAAMPLAYVAMILFSTGATCNATVTRVGTGFFYSLVE